jgi:hypothetical protein
MPLLEDIPENLPVTPDITFHRLSCSYGSSNPRIKLQLGYFTGNPKQACTDPKLWINPKLNPNFRYVPVITSPSQELFIMGFSFIHVSGEDRMHVAAVHPGSPAEKAGLLMKDLIVALDGDKKVVNNMEDFHKEVAASDEITLTVMRANQVREISMKKFKFMAPKSITLQNQGVLGNVMLAVPGQLIDTQPLIDQAKMLLDSVSRVAIRCD